MSRVLIASNTAPTSDFLKVATSNSNLSVQLFAHFSWKKLIQVTHTAAIYWAVASGEYGIGNAMFWLYAIFFLWGDLNETVFTWLLVCLLWFLVLRFQKQILLSISASPGFFTVDHGTLTAIRDGWRSINRYTITGITGTVDGPDHQLAC